MSGILDPPARPLDISRFTSNELFGQPGIYPDGPTMAPASGEPLRDAQAAALLERWGGRSLEVYRSAEVASVTEVPQMRAAISLLVGSPAEPLMEALLAGGSHIHELGVGALAQPGRVVGGPAADARAGVRWLNERYAAEHPAVVAPSLAHAICHHDTAHAGRWAAPTACNAEEATLHGVLAAVHAWLVGSAPELADLGSELSRRQASLTITLLNARSAGSPVPSIVCPDGPGTIPGGNPDLQCPDLWSIPFTSVDPDDCDTSVPAPVRSTLRLLARAGAPPPPDTYSEDLASWLRANTCRGKLDDTVVGIAGRALGLWRD